MNFANTPNVKEKILMNCWSCDNMMQGSNTCKCDVTIRRASKRKSKQRFKRDLRDGSYDY